MINIVKLRNVNW